MGFFQFFSTVYGLIVLCNLLKFLCRFVVSALSSRSNTFEADQVEFSGISNDYLLSCRFLCVRVDKGTAGIVKTVHPDVVVLCKSSVIFL